LKRPTLAQLGPSLILALAAFGIDRAHKLLQLSPECLGGSCIFPTSLFSPSGLTGWMGGEYVPVTPFFDLVLVWNTGISYGLLGELPIMALAILIAAALIGLAVWWYLADSGLLRAGLALAIGGALSNALDRWLYGAVADFFHFHWQNWSFYIFNLADAAITIGVLLLLLDFVGIGRGKRSERIAA